MVDQKDGADMIRMSDYSYHLEESSIARYPASPRGSSKLLRVSGDRVMTFYDNFSNHFVRLSRGTHVLFNDSRVLDARLFVNNKIELMILDLGNVDVKEPCQSLKLRAMIRTDTVRKGDELREDHTGVKVQVVSLEGIWEEDKKSDGNGLDCFVTIQSELSLQELLEKAGSVPIPPYFQRNAEESDTHAYNNVYAAENGSVAAPTAGLHFTQDILEKIGNENTSFLTLHVGAGTFKPVLKENAAHHDMHAESFAVSVTELKRIIETMDNDKPLIVVGTTSCRTLESLYWCGVKLLVGEKDMDVKNNMELAQFEWKSLSKASQNVTNVQAFQALVKHAGNEGDSIVCGRTSLMITPESYQFKVVDHLVTNFHAPDSTLMLLVSAFVGTSRIKEVYEEAQKKGYRFLSYGDVCLFSRPGCALPIDQEEQ